MLRGEAKSLTETAEEIASRGIASRGIDALKASQTEVKEVKELRKALKNKNDVITKLEKQLSGAVKGETKEEGGERVAALVGALKDKEKETSARILKWQSARLHEAFRLVDLDQSGTICEDECFSLCSSLDLGDWDQSHDRRAFRSLDAHGKGNVHREEFISFHEDMLGDLSDADFNAAIDKFTDAARLSYTEKLSKREEQCRAREARIEGGQEGGITGTRGALVEGEQTSSDSGPHPAEAALALYKAHSVGQKSLKNGPNFDKLGEAGDVYFCVVHWRMAAGIPARSSLFYRCLRYLMLLAEVALVLIVVMYAYAWRQKRMQKQYA